MMSDAARGESVMYKTLECSMCLEIYNPPEKIPKNLICGHILCSKCLTNILESGKVKCSKCRHETLLPQRRIADLMTNFSVMEILESTCEICRVQHWVHRCDHCSKKMCGTCKISHSELEWKEMKEELLHAKRSVEDMAGMYLDDTILKEISSQEKSTEKEIREFWKYIQKKVKLRMEKDIKKSIYHFQEKYKNIKDWQMRFEKQVDQASAVMTECMTKFEENTSDEVMVHEHLQMKQEYEQILLTLNHHLSEMPPIDIMHLNPAIEGMFEYIISNGAIRTKPDYKSATFSHSYGQHGSGPGEFNCPHDIAISPVTGNVVVSDFYNHRVHYLTSSLQPMSVYGSQGSGDQQIQHPRGVAVSNKGKVYIADWYNHRIHVTDENGKCLSVIESESDRFKFPHGIAVDSNGLLYVCDGENYRIQVLTEDGSLIRKFGSHGTDLGQFEYKPTYIAVSADGILAVSGFRKLLQILTTQGEHMRTITADSSTSFTEPNGVVFDPDGNIIVADHKGGLLVMTKEGQVFCQISTAGTGTGQLQTPHGVTLTADGDILVCDYKNHRILKFSVPKI